MNKEDFKAAARLEPNNREARQKLADVEKALRPKKGQDDYNVRAVRDALRVFVVTWLGMKGWDAVARRFQDSKE